MGARFEASTVDEESLRAYRGKEKVKTDEILQDYLSICLYKGVCTKCNSVFSILKRSLIVFLSFLFVGTGREAVYRDGVIN